MNEKQKKLDVRFNQIREEHDAYHVRYSESTLFDLRDCALALLADEPEKSLRDYTLAELAELVHDMAKEKGWWDAPREWPEIACLIHSEISEAVECYRRGEMSMHLVDGKPEGLVVELADVVIRCLDYTAYLKQYAGDYVIHEIVRKPPVLLGKTDMLGMLFECHGTVATEVIHNPCIENIIWNAVSVAHHYGLDLPAAIEAKVHYNATRPYRHGGKKA